MNKCKVKKIVAMLVFAGVVLAGLYAQTPDQSALLQALGGAQGGQGATGAAGGAAGVTAPPAVTQLSAPSAGAVQTKTTEPKAASAQALSAIERMFANMAAGLGTPAQNLTQFGYSLFDMPSAPSFAAIGDDYVLGPGDGLVLYLWGDAVDLRELSPSYTLTVDRNGAIFLPPVGQVSVWGQDIGSVRGILKSMLDRRYKRLEMNLTLGTLRQFPVFVSGYAGSPGTVLANGADTVLTVLSRAGGILKTGSLRSVVLTRQGKGGASERIEIDFYESLLQGKPIDLRVREGDSIFIPGIGPVVALAGELRLPGIYELKQRAPGAAMPSLEAALALAGGVLPSARSGAVTLLRYGEAGKELVTGNIQDRAFAGRQAVDGDFIYFGKISDLLLGQVEVSGAARYPGRYDIASFRSLKALLQKAQLLPETNLYYGRVYRMDQSGKDRSFAFSPGEVLAAGEGSAGAAADVPLAEFDKVVLFRYADTGIDPDLDRFENTVVVSGPVKYPGFYLYKSGMKLSSVLTADQLLLDTNEQYGEIVRLRKDGKHEYVTFRPGEVVAGKWDLELGSRDVIRLVKVGYRPAQVDMDRFVDSVMVEGPVEFGGVYAWREGMRLGELMKLAKPRLEANQVYAEVVRPLAGGKNEYVTFALREVVAGEYDLVLRARDRVRLYSTAAVLTVGKAGVQEGGTAVAGTEGTPAVGTGVQEGAASPAAASVPAGTGSGIETDLGAFLEVVQVSGAIRYQGPYARTPSLKLSSVVTVEQILEETNLEYAELTRLRADGTPEYHTFSPKAVLEGNYDLALQAKDSIRFVKKASFGGKGESPDFEKFSEVVQLTGQAARPEVYALRPGMKLSEVVTKDQLLLDTNQQYGEIVRLRKDGKHEYVTFRPGEVVAGKWDLELGSRDVIRLVKVGYRPAQVDVDRFVDSVMVEGPVEFGGVYAWREGMRLGELMKLAKPRLEANQVYAEVVRPLAGGKNEYVTFALREVVAGEYDLVLRARDRVRLYSTAAVLTVGKAGVQEGGTAVAGTEGTPAVGTGVQEGAASPAAASVPAGTGSGIETDLGAFLEVVQVSGAIRYQGPYARTPSLMLSSVVTRDQILQETSLDYAELTRRKPDGSWEYLTFAPRDVLNGEFDLKLRAMDSIRFVPVKYLPEKFDFDKFGNAFAIVGAANYPGLYSLGKRRMLSEIITQDQLISTTDNFYAEIERWSAGGRIEYLTFNPTAVLNGKQDFPIMPRDIIRLVPEGGTGEAHNFARYPDTVLVKGVIRYPSRYAWYRGMRLSDIIQESDLLIDTETGYAEIKRYGQNTDSIINFAPAQLAAGKADFELMPRDIVIFYPKYYYRPISVAGEVAEPKIIPYFENIELSSVLRSVVLLRDMANLKAEIKKQSGETTEVYLEDYLKRQPDRKVLLAPGDAITIKQLLPNEHLPVVVVRGEVKEPKTLAFKEGMRLADALRDAGGYESTAYQKGIVLIRKSVADAQQKQIDRLIAQLEAATSAGSVLPSAADTALNSASALIANLQIDLAIQKSKLGNLKQVYKEGFGRITLEIPDTLEELETSPANIRLERDDLIFVPKMPTFVIVSGEVASQNVVLYREGMTVRQAIAESGWLSKEADLANAFIIRASGKLDSTEGKGFLWFKPNILNYRLNPGDTVFVPTKSAKVSVAWAYLRDSFMIISTVLTSALTAKTLLGL